ncbi:phage tail protein [Chromobacterium amazonense]|uniref:baseplate assembly protein n=1 Tax=Chromobacterium amazonense TaxID=1382803 RepID=UPI0008D9A3C8|nr:baseplate J/gp47 family protein [Chromobacterium amazonense]OHX15330.1 phage tail protein [Chromobacterium amazonense]
MAIDLTRLPAPAIIEPLDYEALLAEYKAQLLQLAPAELRDSLAAALQLESESLTLLLELAAYRDLLQRQRINEAAKASLLAYAEKTDLDNRAADYGVQRLLIQPANPDATPPTDAIWESDERLRYRAQMALEGLSVAGSRGAYEFHALRASGDIAGAFIDSPTFRAVAVPPAIAGQLPAGAIVLACDYAAGLDSPLPGDVSIAVLPRQGLDGADLPARVELLLRDDDVRPITDRPRALLGQAIPFEVDATIEMEQGPDLDVVLKAAREALANMLAHTRQLHGEVARSAIFGALHVHGVRRVELRAPADDIRCDGRHYPDCRKVRLVRADA